MAVAHDLQHDLQKDPFRWVMLLFICLFYFVILGLLISHLIFY